MAEDLQINKSYADNYNKWRGKEELQRLKDKYGDDAPETSESESESDMSDAVDSDQEEDWLKTLTAIRNKDPRIYNKDEQFYREKDEASEGGEDGEEKKSSKPMFLKDMERKVILEHDGKYIDDDNSDGENANTSRELQKPSYNEEQRELQKSLVDAAFVDSDDEGGDLLFKRKEKSSSETKQEEDSYNEWKEKQPKKEPSTSTSKPNSELWSSINRDDSDKYLRNYIMNKKYLTNQDENLVPSYEDIVADEQISEDEKLVDNQEDFERKFNFRFEEPDPDFIKSYPRTTSDSLRRKNTSRVDKRKEMKDRKLAEKEQKKSELRQLKQLKRREIESKLEQLRNLVGDGDAFKDVDIDGDFDPQQHDQIMQNIFTDGYYDKEEDQAIKPVFSDEDNDAIDWDKWGTGEDKEEYEADGDEEETREGGQGEESLDVSRDGEYVEMKSTEEEGQLESSQQQYNNDEDFNMDADYNPNIVVKRQKSKKGRQKSRFERALMKKKPVFEPSEKTFEQYLKEYYSLDCEDVIDDMPCRFKYRQVVANDFGLSTDEIINARDKELNGWASIKKMSQYRSEEMEMEDKDVYTRKSYNKQKKAKMFPSLQEKDEPCSSKDVLAISIDKLATGKHTAFEPESPSKTLANSSKSRDQTTTKSEDVSAPDLENSKTAANCEINGDVTKKENLELDSEPVSKKKKKKKKKKRTDDLNKQPVQTNTTENTSTKNNSLIELNKETPLTSNPKANNSSLTKVTKIQNATKKIKNTKKKVVKKSLSNVESTSKPIKKKKKKKKAVEIISDERLKSFGINPKKYKYEILKGKHEKIKKMKE